MTQPTNVHPDKKYWAFISYSSKDKRWGSWLHRRLENYPIPKEFRGKELFDGAVLGKNLRPIFRDRDELAGSSDLDPAILKALKQSRYLIVLCSKNSAKSKWVDKEITDFKALHPENEKRILALILDGEPNASTRPEVDDNDECFPPSLRYPSEPLAGDLRKEGDGKERGFLKVLAGLSQIGFDALHKRHVRARKRRQLLVSLTTTCIIALLAGLSIFAFKQKANAESEKNVAITAKEQAIQQKELAQNEALSHRSTCIWFVVELHDILNDTEELISSTEEQNKLSENYESFVSSRKPAFKRAYETKFDIRFHYDVLQALIKPLVQGKRLTLILEAMAERNKIGIAENNLQESVHIDTRWRRDASFSLSGCQWVLTGVVIDELLMSQHGDLQWKEDITSLLKGFHAELLHLAQSNSSLDLSKYIARTISLTEKIESSIR